MFATGTPKLAKYLLAGTVASFLAVVARDGFGVGFPLWTDGWDNTYSLTEFLGLAVCAVRIAHVSGRERAAWLALTLGLFAYFAGDLYYTIVITPTESTAPFPSPADAGYLAIYPASYVALVLLLRARAGRIPSSSGSTASSPPSPWPPSAPRSSSASWPPRRARWRPSPRTSRTPSATSRCWRSWSRSSRSRAGAPGGRGS